jgi:tRNA nucleotidyltransferase (CCA-adding enzyme)
MAPEPRDPDALRIPAQVERVIGPLWEAGHAAYVVGGSVRDSLLGRTVKDWDVATDALPERILELLPAGSYRNRFGTVTVEGVEITTFRRDHVYRDHRRPDTVTFTDSLEEDLVRRDFTVNAIAYGRAVGAIGAGWGRPDRCFRRPRSAPTARGRRPPRSDSTRTRCGSCAASGSRRCSGSRSSPRPAMPWQLRRRRCDGCPRSASRTSCAGCSRRCRRRVACGCSDELGLLGAVLPELAAQRGIPTNKSNGVDLWGHTLAALDATTEVAADDPVLRLAALLHDVGKPMTQTDDGFHGHEVVGASVAERILERMAFTRVEVERVRELVRQHMFSYEPNWTDAAVRGSSDASDRPSCRSCSRCGGVIRSAAGYRRRRPPRGAGAAGRRGARAGRAAVTRRPRRERR